MTDQERRLAAIEAKAGKTVQYAPMSPALCDLIDQTLVATGKPKLTPEERAELHPVDDGPLSPELEELCNRIRNSVKESDEREYAREQERNNSRNTSYLDTSYSAYGSQVSSTEELPCFRNPSLADPIYAPLPTPPPRRQPPPDTAERVLKAVLRRIPSARENLTLSMLDALQAEVNQILKEG